MHVLLSDGVISEITTFFVVARRETFVSLIKIKSALMTIL
jgi:hypothetical protein